MKSSEVKSDVPGLSYKVFVLSALLMLNSCNDEDIIQTQNIESYAPKQSKVGGDQNGNNSEEEDKKEDEKEPQIKEDHVPQKSETNDNQNNNNCEEKIENELQVQENYKDDNLNINQEVDNNLFSTNDLSNCNLDNKDEMSKKKLGNLNFKLNWDDRCKSYKLILSKVKGKELNTNDYTINITYKNVEESKLQIIAKFNSDGIKYVTFEENGSCNLADLCSGKPPVIKNEKTIYFNTANWKNEEKVDVKLTVKYKGQEISFDMSFYKVIKNVNILSPDKILLQVKRNEKNKNQLDLRFLSKDGKCEIVKDKVFLKYICYCNDKAINGAIQLLKCIRENRSFTFMNINNYDLSNFIKLKFLKTDVLTENDFVKINIGQYEDPDKLDCDKIKFFAYEKNEKGEETNVVELGSWIPKSDEWVPTK